SEPRCLDYSLVGQTLAVICADGRLVLVDPGNGRGQRQWQARPPDYTHRWWINHGAVRISPDGQRVLTFGTEKVVRVFDVATGHRRCELPHQGNCRGLHFSPDGRRVATASRDKTVRVWELATGRPLGEPLRHPHSVFTAPFSPDGKYVLTGCH